MTKAKSLMVTGILALFSASAFAAPLPSEIYRPAGAHTVKADHQGNKVIAHAHSKGFRVVESEIKRDDADLKFRRGRQELDVSIESKDHGRIEYKADLDLNR